MSTPVEKSKMFKNPSRKFAPNYERFVPNYQQMQIDPQKHETRNVPRGTIVSSGGPNNIPAPSRNRVQTYATPVQTLSGNQHMVNVGNNMEHTWSGVDGEIIDDISDVDVNQQMVDNNNYVDIENNDVAALNTKQMSQSDFNLYESISTAESSEVLVVVGNELIFVGSTGDSQEVVKLLVFGEHPFCQGQPIDPDDISCLMKMKIKTGVFLEVSNG